MPSTRVFLARHGQTVTNREGRFCGHYETTLTPLGEKQAHALGQRLASTEIGAAYSSDLSRAIETAKRVLGERRLPVTRSAALRELHYGEWEGRLEREVAKDYPEQHKLMRDEDPAWRPPGGETILEVRERITTAVREIAERHPGQTVLIVSHGTAINCLVSGLIGIPPHHTFRFDVANCGLSEIEFNRGRPLLTLLNSTGHLTGIS